MNILITCCLGDHIRSNVEDIKSAYPNCKIVGVDMRYMFFNHNGLDAFYQVPRCDDPNYVSEILEVCKKEKIDIVISFSSLDIEPFYDHRGRFLENGVIVALGDNVGTLYANDKDSFIGHCLVNCLNVIPPTERDVRTSAELLKWMKGNDISRVVTKMNNSTGAKGMNYYSIDDLEDNDFTFDAPVIAQKYLSGTEYSVDCFCDNGKVLFSCLKKNYEMDLGVSIYSEIVEDDKGILDMCKDACKIFYLQGLVGFDVKEDENGVPYILECNPRPTATISLVAAAGVNLLKHLIEYYKFGMTEFFKDGESLTMGMKIARFRDDYFFEEVPKTWKKP